jgi:2-isopropylmalate synthase
LNDLGYKFNENKINDLFEKFKDLADKKKQIFDEDLLAIADEEQALNKSNLIQLIDVEITSGLKQKANAEVKLKYKNKILSKNCFGSGPVDAVFKVIKKIVNIKSSLVVYQVNAITKGTDAQAEVSVRLEDNGVSVLGVGNDIDTIVASGKAYINALNKLILKKDKAADSKRTLKSQSKKIDKHVI